MDWVGGRVDRLHSVQVCGNARAESPTFEVVLDTLIYGEWHLILFDQAERSIFV